MVRRSSKSSRRRRPSAYNKFMSKTIKDLQKSKPSISHKTRFKLAAKMWGADHSVKSSRRRSRKSSQTQKKFSKSSQTQKEFPQERSPTQEFSAQKELPQERSPT